MPRVEARRLSTRTRLRIAAAVSGFGVAVGAIGAVATEPALILPAGLAVLASAYLALLSMRLADDVEATRGAVLAAGDDGQLPPLRSDVVPLAEVRELREAIARRLAEAAGASGDRHLASVIAALPDGVIVATPEGLISAANHGGRRALAAGSAVVGTSLFGRLSRASVAETLTAVERAGRPLLANLATVESGDFPAVVATLGPGQGIVIVVRGSDVASVEHRAEIEMDLALHDLPPAAPAPTDATPLADAPLLVLDTETTGMVPEHDRIVSIGAVRLHGRRLFRARLFDALVRPGRHIPASATAVHRISDAMVADAPDIRDVWGRLSQILVVVVVVGHHIDFDLAMLRSAAARDGLPWREPIALDTARLAAALDPSERSLDLTDVARRHGVVPTGRHTALGDSLATAELYLRLMPRLLGRGILTVGDAIRFGNSATAVVEAQRATPWGRR
ncbi:MAG: 3'-5' exonuclease [Alphaproteobacteria bacterium]|nr:3'-5' exonuclease [Alphaproteobacteria bacterium]